MKPEDPTSRLALLSGTGRPHPEVSCGIYHISFGAPPFTLAGRFGARPNRCSDQHETRYLPSIVFHV